MVFTTNDAGSDWYPVFHHPSSELRVSECREVISPSQLEYSDRGEKGRKTADREERRDEE